MKKKIAIAIAFMMFLNIFSGLLPQGRLSAAALQLSASFFESLTEGLTDPVPKKDNNGTKANQASLTWPIVDDFGMNAFIGHYRLVYPIDNGRVVSFDFKKNGDVMDVEYRVFTDSTLTTEVPASGYTPYRVNGNFTSPQTQPKYVDYNIYNNYGEINYMVDTGNSKPTFKITANRGFSFILYNNVIHFLWENVAGKNQIHVVTDGVNPGRLYDFTLYYANSLTSPSLQPISDITLFNGINISTFTATPTADGSDTISQPLTDTANILDWFTQSPVPVPPPANYMIPPATNTGIVVEFDMPKKWNGSNGYTAPVGDGDLPNLQINLFLRNATEASQERQILMRNIFSSNITVSNAANVSASLTNERMRVTIEKVAPGMLFNESNCVFITSSQKVLSRYVTLPNDKIYTFLPYEVVYLDGKFYVHVEPFKGYTGYYMLLVGPNSDERGRKATVIIESDGSSDLFMPITLSIPAMEHEFIQVLFNRRDPFPNNEPAPNSLRSQIMDYQATNDKKQIGVPSNFRINEYKLKQLKPDSEPNWEHMGDLRFKLSWDIGSLGDIKDIFDAKGINEMTITYDIQNTLTPADPGKTKIFSTIDYIISRDASGKFYGEVRGVNGETPLPRDTADPVTNKFLLDSYLYPGTDATVAKAILEYDMKAIDSSGVVPPGDPIKYWFQYPNIYFLNTKITHIAYGSAGSKPVTISSSLYDSMTLNDLSKLEFPPPQNVTVDNPVLTETPLHRISLDVRYDMPGPEIKDYIDSMFETTGADIRYNIYIAQDENKLRDILKITDPAKRGDNTVNVAYNPNPGDPSVLYMSPINGPASQPVTAPDGRYGLDVLRRGDVLRISGIPVGDALAINEVIKGNVVPRKFTIDGLDKNQRYYVIVDSYIVLKYLDNASQPKELYDYSKPSGIGAETTLGERPIPGPEEKNPSAPTLNKENVTLSSADIFWNSITEPAIPGQTTTFEYEMIRLKDIPMDSKLLDTRLLFKDFYDQNMPAGAEKVGLRTKLDTAANRNRIYYYDGNQTSMTEVTDGKFEYSVEGVARLIDKSLKPNCLYYYYVRTVRITDGKEAYSVWSAISVTTTPVKPPINLKVERTVAGITYDNKTQFIISFDAPVKDANGLGVDYNFQYSMRMDTGSWEGPVTMDNAQLTSHASPAETEGYYHFVYLISGLKPGTNYAIMVRLFDLLNQDASIYSNIAETRTEVDQEDYNNDKLTNDWFNRFKELLQEYLKNDYWPAGNDKVNFTPVYRPSQFDNLLAKTVGGSVVLAETEAAGGVYYIPQSALISAHNAGKGFTIKHGDVEVSIPARAVSVDDNDVILQTKNNIKNKKAVDYYLRISLKWTSLSAGYMVDGYSPASPQVEIRMDIVETKKDNRVWDDEILVLLVNRLANDYYGGNVKKDIYHLIQNNTSSEVMVKRLEAMAADAIEEMAADVDRELQKALSGSRSVANVDQTITIKLYNAGLDEVVGGYTYRNGSWIQADTVDISGVRAILTRITGIFVFNKYVPYFKGISGMEGSKDLTDIIVRYRLDDYLGKGDAFNLEGSVTTFMAAGVAARIGGADKTADPVSFLKDKGYTVISRSSRQPATNQETIYFVMAVYEMKTGTKVSTVKIRNYSLTGGIKGIDDRYLKSVQAAFELGIYNNKQMVPKGTPKVRELLDMLYQLNLKKKL